MESDKIEIFTAYIEDSMPISERQAFEKQLETDEELAAAFKEYRDIYQILENRFSPQRAAVLENIQKSGSQFQKSDRKNLETPKTIVFKPWQIGVAASILLIVGFLVFNSLGKPSYAKYADPGEIALTVRGDTESVAKMAEISFNRKDYMEAISYFDTLLDESSENSELKFYKAIALVETDQFAEAEMMFQALSNGTSAYSYKAVYWNALSKLKQKNYDETKALLQKIPSHAPEYKLAQKLLSHL